MNSHSCLNFNQIYKYVTNKVSQKERKLFEKEFETCADCKEKLKIINSLKTDLPNKSQEQKSKTLDLSLENFFSLKESFFNKELSEAESDRFYETLLAHPEFFVGFKEILDDEVGRGEPGKAERKILSQISSAKVSDRLAQYEERYLKKTARRFPVALRLPQINSNKPTTLFAFAVIAFFILFFYMGYQKKVFDTAVQVATNDYYEAIQTLPVIMSEPRFSGTEANEFLSFKITRSNDDSDLEQHRSENIEKALKLNPDDARLNHKLGVVKYLNGHKSEAEKLFRNAIRLDKNFPPPYNDLSFIMIEKGKHQEALKLLQTALEKSPNFLEAHFNLAIVYEQLNENKKAITAWKDYLKMEKNKSVIKAVKFRIRELEEN